jgi:7-carboxy-7-deazaguanine synthase
MRNTPHTSLPVMEHFYTVQGEGQHQGKAAYFIRLAGCDVGCVWCDVKESWDMTAHPVLSIDELVNAVKSTPATIAVITGGEPLLHDLTELTNALNKQGVSSHLETSGSSPLSGQWDWICLSPKKFKAPLDEVIEKCDELKIVVFNKSDLNWAEQFIPKLKKGCKLFLQPEWEKSKEVLPLIVEHIKANPQWELSLQIHKYIDVP